jgi:L-ribulokinase
MAHFVEAADWIVWQLCGSYVRNACTAGYKGICQDGTTRRGLPGRAQPGLRELRRRQARRSRSAAGRAAGTLTAQAAGGPGCPRASPSRSATSTRTSPRRRQALEPGQMVAIMGTSTCHVMNGDELREVPGMCGVVDGGIVAGPVGLRGRAERRRRHLRLVRRHRCRRVPRAPSAA